MGSKYIDNLSGSSYTAKFIATINNQRGDIYYRSAPYIVNFGVIFISLLLYQVYLFYKENQILSAMRKFKNQVLNMTSVAKHRLQEKSLFIL
jgi:hypothetical protein